MGRKFALIASAVAAALTLVACGGVEDPRPTTELATVSPSTEPVTSPLLSTTSQEVPSELPPEQTQPKTPAVESEQPAVDERPAQLFAPAPAPAAPPQSAHYGSCDAARAAGAAPLYAGDPGYRRGLDRDGDGIACE